MKPQDPALATPVVRPPGTVQAALPLPARPEPINGVNEQVLATDAARQATRISG